MRLHPRGTSARRAQDRGNRAPTVLWTLRRPAGFPFVRTGERDTVDREPPWERRW